MRLLFMSLIGALAAILTTVSWIPQVVRSWKRRSAGDFSWGYLMMFAGGVVSWEIYGLLRNDPAVIAANAVTILLVLTVIGVKVVEHRRRSSPVKSRPAAGASLA